MRLTFGALAVVLVLSVVLLGVSYAFAQTIPMIPPPTSANQTSSGKQAHLFGSTTTYNVNVVCSNGQTVHKSQTVQAHTQPAPTINVNCSTGGASSNGTVATGQPAVICIVTPENSCASVIAALTAAPATTTK